MGHERTFDYDAFISYSTASDYELVRTTESFLERIHQLKTPEPLNLKKLEICLDGSDFKLPRIPYTDPTQPLPDPIKSIILEYLRKSKYLIVFCSPKARNSTWVNDEIQLFLDIRSSDNILLVVSEGLDPGVRPEEVFHEILIENGLHKKIYYDFRGYYKKRSPFRLRRLLKDHQDQKVRNYEAERVRLAADLQPDENVTAGVLQPLWFTEQLSRARRNLAMAVSVIMALAVLAGIAWYQRHAKEQQRQIALARQLTAQAELARNDLGLPINLSALLAVEATRRSASLESDWVLRETLSLLPRRLWYAPHPIGIAMVTISPDARFLGTLGVEGSARLLDASTGELLIELRHQAKIVALRFLGPEHLLAADSDGTVATFEVPTGHELMRFEHGPPVTILAVSRDRSLAAIAGGGPIHVFDPLTGHGIWETSSPASVSGMTLSDDGEYLAMLSDDHTVRVLRVRDGIEVFRKVYTEPPRTIALSPNGASLAIGSSDGILRLLDIATGRETWKARHNAPVGSVVFSPDGRMVATASADESARAFETETGKEHWRHYHPTDVCSVLFSPDGELVVTISHDNVARVLDAGSGDELSRATLPDVVSSVAIDPAGRRLAVSGEDGGMSVFDRIRGNEILRLCPGEESLANGVLSPNGRRVAWSCGMGWGRVAEIDDGRILVDIDAEIGSWAFDSTGRRLAASVSGEIHLLDVEMGTKSEPMPRPVGSTWITVGPTGRYGFALSSQLVQLIEVATGAVVAQISIGNEDYPLALNEDGQYVAASGKTGMVKVFAVSRRAEVWRKTHIAPVSGLAFSPTGKYLASAWQDGTVRVFETSNGKLVTELPQHTRFVSTLAFSGDEVFLATGGWDRRGRVFVTRTGREVARLNSRYGPRTLVFTPDRSQIITISGSRGIVEEHPFGDMALVAETCVRLTQPLSEAEWSHYLPNDKYRDTCWGMAGR
jgi:WD40 repeat protein